MDAQSRSRLILEIGKQCVELDHSAGADGRVVTLGHGAENDLVFGSPYASRSHAHIEVRRSSFYLVDASTNGTFVQTDDENIRYVHRDALRLWGGGWLALGEPLHSCQPIRFQEALV